MFSANSLISHPRCIIWTLDTASLNTIQRNKWFIYKFLRNICLKQEHCVWSCVPLVRRSCVREQSHFQKLCIFTNHFTSAVSVSFSFLADFIPFNFSREQNKISYQVENWIRNLRRKLVSSPTCVTHSAERGWRDWHKLAQCTSGACHVCLCAILFFFSKFFELY